MTFDGDWRCSVDARWRPIWLMRAELRGPTLRKPILFGDEPIGALDSTQRPRSWASAVIAGTRAGLTNAWLSVVR